MTQIKKVSQNDPENNGSMVSREKESLDKEGTMILKLKR
jgi:hypothetical protein